MNPHPRPACIPNDVWVEMHPHEGKVVSSALALGWTRPQAQQLLPLVPRLGAEDYAHLPADAGVSQRNAERTRLRKEFAERAASFMRALDFFLRVQQRDGA